MLTGGDDYPLHQTSEPIAHVATGDRNFYDRYFFNGYSRDGDVYFAVALGVYPNRGVMDAAVSVLHRGRHHVVRGSRRAPVDRLDTSVGPISVQVVEPLRRLRVVVGANDAGVAFDAEFRARGPVLEEPRFSRRSGVRSVMDYTRLTQHGGWDGRLALPGLDVALSPDAFWGSRDRSWGIRPVGEPESGAMGMVPQFFWLWAPFNFPRTLTHFDVNEEEDGRRWHETGFVLPVGASDPLGLPQAVSHDLRWQRGTRRIEGGSIGIGTGRGASRIELRPLGHFTMSTIGYLHPTWGHATDHGDLAVACETVDAVSGDDVSPLHLHVQTICEAVLERDGEPAETGIGVLEQLVLGAHRPYGFTGLIDGAP
ncbi:MAG: hypothetical protein ACKOCT_14580 [Alphaproteobacteria bacterium]